MSCKGTVPEERIILTDNWGKAQPLIHLIYKRSIKSAPCRLFFGILNIIGTRQHTSYIYAPYAQLSYITPTLNGWYDFAKPRKPHAPLILDYVSFACQSDSFCILQVCLDRCDHEPCLDCRKLDTQSDTRTNSSTTNP